MNSAWYEFTWGDQQTIVERLQNIFPVNFQFFGRFIGFHQPSIEHNFVISAYLPHCALQSSRNTTMLDPAETKVTGEI